ncbi:MAG: alcohol dehydrogenase catalytic domain-containing protein [Alphaproteobacteria bacterium]|nr:alcohol dehydrogenase catalytic domain-containing protein [Alphaproteobacteria bacterium]
MRAAVFSEMSKPLVIQAIADPVCGATDLILKVKNCGICGSDLHMTEPSSAMPLPVGSVMGHEFSGEVVEVGRSARGSWHVGDRVAGFPVICCGEHQPCINLSQRGTCTKMLAVGLGASPGAYAEYVRIGAESGYRLPQSVSFREGAMVEPLAVGLHAVDMARMPRGATVLVVGAGPVGLATMLWANFLGARHVIVSERAETRRNMAAKFGATEAVDSSQPLTPQVEKIAGKAPDVIFECVGVPGLIGQTMMEAPRGCRIVVAGVCQQPDMIVPLVGIMKELEVQFVLGYRPADFDYVIAMIATDRVDVGHMLTDIVDLDGLPSAFEALRKPSHQCKVMLEN